jgi:hypothetical protein
LPFHEAISKMMIVLPRTIGMLDLALVVIGLDFEEGGASRSPRLGRASIRRQHSREVSDQVQRQRRPVHANPSDGGTCYHHM